METDRGNAQSGRDRSGRRSSGDFFATSDHAAGRSGVGGTGGPAQEPYSSAALVARVAALLIVFGAGFWLFATRDARRFDAGIFLRPVAERMKLGETYDPQVLTAMEADLSDILTDRVCDHQALQDFTVLRAALAETAFQDDDADVADRRLSAAEIAARATLACSPGSATAWTILAWIEHIRHGDTPLLRTYLHRSQHFGPYEGWVLIRRMEMLLSLYPALNSEEQKGLRQAVEWIVNGGMSEFIGEQYVNANPEQRRALRDILADAPERQQKRAAEFIRDNGEDIDLPFVEPLGSRPWK
ncbi:hypothetical protein V5F72_05365 [Xanthobacter flavus]|uniref:hypothetical protein n=1 Tax=Xanthobacter flavus TaxID=281 RepID=UPI0037278A5C